ncbi:hypothetical protein AX769_11465 [Frondihabitans sp. PAMC 28766]|uniref:hypothetical protein n=1 Tax=Frondihabitans sp. PAMC 28766 TaxID=1795630 RepID=UPI00078D72B1|nr:hypothetical protein [Frondihabitans sp. PAMC 28766]AMM20648.1 hypothetical protein AX769_11465 [Frondihabitans sp. PAMC 28766]
MTYRRLRLVGFIVLVVVCCVSRVAVDENHVPLTTGAWWAMMACTIAGWAALMSSHFPESPACASTAP